MPNIPHTKRMPNKCYSDAQAATASTQAHAASFYASAARDCGLDTMLRRCLLEASGRAPLRTPIRLSSDFPAVNPWIFITLPPLRKPVLVLCPVTLLFFQGSTLSGEPLFKMQRIWRWARG
jgi:hypothetical protein